MPTQGLEHFHQELPPFCFIEKNFSDTDHELWWVMEVRRKLPFVCSLSSYFFSEFPALLLYLLPCMINYWIINSSMIKDWSDLHWFLYGLYILILQVVLYLIQQKNQTDIIGNQFCIGFRSQLGQTWILRSNLNKEKFKNGCCLCHILEARVKSPQIFHQCWKLFWQHRYVYVIVDIEDPKNFRERNWERYQKSIKITW